jgi:hypothetical protein
MPFAVRRRVRAIVAGLLVLEWAVGSIALAAVDAAHPDLLALPWLQAGLGILIATGASAASTLMRYAGALATGTPFHVRAEFAKDMSAGACVGVVVYYAGWSHGISTPDLAAALVLGGFGAARLLTLAVALMERRLKLRTGNTKPGDLT